MFSMDESGNITWDTPEERRRKAAEYRRLCDMFRYDRKSKETMRFSKAFADVASYIEDKVPSSPGREKVLVMLLEAYDELAKTVLIKENI